MAIKKISTHYLITLSTICRFFFITWINSTNASVNKLICYLFFPTILCILCFYVVFMDSWTIVCFCATPIFTKISDNLWECLWLCFSISQEIAFIDFSSSFMDIGSISIVTVQLHNYSIEEFSKLLIGCELKFNLHFVNVCAVF